jgi:hypothetical protein
VSAGNMQGIYGKNVKLSGFTGEKTIVWEG